MWSDILHDEKNKAYFKDTLSQISAMRKDGVCIYPDDKHIFEAFRLAQLEQLKVVILGQDPYHNPGQAHGLCFSVPKNVAIPPSLKNIYKELKQDIGCPIPEHGNLESWARQGILLLNTILTVEAGKPQSHQSLGWQQFTDRVIELINIHCSHVVFLLWGANAQRKTVLIDSKKHSILTAPHPSPLSSYRGFFGCKHFSKCNQLLLAHQQQPIEWNISEAANNADK